MLYQRIQKEQIAVKHDCKILGEHVKTQARAVKVESNMKMDF